jgi:hypothetical protein
MRLSQEEKVFYEALWFNEENLDGPIVRGYHVENIINKILRITKDDNGTVELYKFTYNERGYKVELYKKLLVINVLKLDEF